MGLTLVDTVQEALETDRFGHPIRGFESVGSTNTRAAAWAEEGAAEGVDSRLADLRDREAVAATVADCAPEVVLHMAAQALVLPGYEDPVGTFATNVMGTAHLLEALRGSPDLKAVVCVTSDKVYENPGTGVPLTEADPLGGRDPYSASKAASEMAVRSWAESFLEPAGVAVATARAGNVIGGGDTAAHRLLPDLFRALESGAPLVVRHPAATRPWQHVLEPLSGYLALARALVERPAKAPRRLNFGPPPADAWPVRRVLAHVAERLGTPAAWQTATGPTPPEAPLLSLDARLAAETLGWRPRLKVAEALAWTADWWREHRAGADARALCLDRITRYEARADGPETA